MEYSDAEKRLQEIERKLATDKLRFAIGKPGKRYSGVWAAWSHRSDYYFGARGILGSIKISLHASGICRVALTARHYKHLADWGLPQPSDRAFVKWKRTDAPERGVALAAVLVFPTDYLTLEEPLGSPQKPQFNIESARPGHALEVGFFYSREPTESLEPKFLEIGKPLFRADLDNGESVSMVVREAAFDPSTLPSNDQLKNGGRLLDPNVPIGIEQEKLAMILWNAPKDGEPLRIIEIGGVTAIRNA